jgi:phosphomannomutase
MRKSNTEPVIRIITEGRSKEEAENLQKFFLKMIRNEIKN